MNSNSPRFSVNGVDLQKVLTGLLVGLSGVGITLLGMLTGVNFSVVVHGTDLGPILTMLVAAIASSLVNLLRKYIASNQ